MDKSVREVWTCAHKGKLYVGVLIWTNEDVLLSDESDLLPGSLNMLCNVSETMSLRVNMVRKGENGNCIFSVNGQQPFKTYSQGTCFISIERIVFEKKMTKSDCERCEQNFSSIVF